MLDKAASLLVSFVIAFAIVGGCLALSILLIWLFNPQIIFDSFHTGIEPR